MTVVPSILIAEDDSYLRDAYARRFAHTEFAVRFASNG
jgi:DNA-binding response OmpR family regulator